MNLASSLAAAIEERFRFNTTLKEGHGGIFEVSVGEELVYTNRGACGQLPTVDEALNLMEYRKSGLIEEPSGETDFCGCSSLDGQLC